MIYDDIEQLLAALFCLVADKKREITASTQHRVRKLANQRGYHVRHYPHRKSYEIGKRGYYEITRRDDRRSGCHAGSLAEIIPAIDRIEDVHDMTAH